MRKLIALITVLLPALTFCLAQQPAGAPVPSKIGFVNSMDVLYGTEEGKQALDRLNKLMQEKQAQFETQKNELDKLRDDLAQKERNLNPQTRQEMANTIAEKEKALTRFQEDAQGEITRRRDEVMGSIGEKAMKIISDYAEKNGFGAIFVKDQQIVTYVAAALDVTPEIIKAYNQQHPVAAAPAATSSATPAPTPTAKP
ncbi:MAG: OmpH family outer membrane protein [Acidobacteriota bacterium]